MLLTTSTRLLRSIRVRVFIGFATMLALLAVMSVSFAGTISTITAQWQNPLGSSGAPTCLTTDNSSATVTVFYGTDDPTLTNCPPDTSAQSGFGFRGSNVTSFTNGTPFLLGELTHYNQQVFASSLLTGATLNLSLTTLAPVAPPITTDVALDETPNNLATCPYGDNAQCADLMSITPTSVQFTDSGTDYQFEILGLIPDTGSGCTYDQASLRLSFVSEENSNNSSCLYGRITPVGDAAMQITKSTSATVLEPGDIVDYQIDYTCASTTDDCLGVQLTDYLPEGLSYVGSTGSVHTVNPTGTYSTGSNTVLFTFVDPLPAGATGFVRIRARVRNDGTLANGQLITNTASSTQTNGPTSISSVSTPVQTISDWQVKKSGDATAYISTEAPITDMHYTVQICPNDSNVNMLGAQMVDHLPTGAVYVTSDGGIYDSTANTITWNLGDLAASAGCASKNVTVRFPNPPFSASQVVDNTVDGTGTIPGVGPFSGTADVPRTLQNFVPLPSVAMDKSTTRNDYVVGASVDYFLTPENTGNSFLYNLTMTDNLPDQIKVTQVKTGASVYPITLEYAVNGSSSYTLWPGSPFTSNTALPVSALGLPNGTWITSIRWDLNPGGQTPPGWTLTSPAVITGTLTSPDRLGNPVANNQIVHNDATLHWEYLPGGSGTCASPNAQCGNSTDGADIKVVILPIPVFSKSSSGGVSEQQRFIVGQDVGHFNLNVNNNTGIAVDNFVLTDDIPTQFGVTSVNVSNASSSVGVRYQTNGSGTWVVWPGSPFAANTTLNVSGLGLGSGVSISKLEFNYGTIPGGFTTNPSINGVTLATGWDGNAVHDGDTMNNNAAMDWTFQGVPSNATDSTSDPIHNPTVTPSASKSVTSSGPYLPTSAVTYRLSFGASGSSPSNVMDNPVVADLLPLNVNYVSYTFNANGSGLTGPSFVQIPNYNGTGQTLLRWTFGGSLSRGQTASIDLSTTLAAGTPSGNLTNTFAVTVNDMPVNGGTPDSQDLDGDGQTTDKIITASTSIPVDQLVGLNSQKGVKGELDSSYSVYPAFGQTVPNGLVAYRLSIINRGNVPVNNVRVIDILPFVGDTGVQDIRPRNSAWRPILTSAVTPQAGVTIYYSTATNPCRPEIVSTGPAGCTAPNWSLTPPADLDTVRSLRFDFAGTLPPGASFTFNWTMRAPASGPTDGQIAWNSFAFTSTNATTGVPLRPAEPNKVGIIYRSSTPTALIELKKYTNDNDADLPPGPLLPIGSTVTWKYVVTNIGQTRLNNITLTDDQIGAITCPPGILEIGASITCTATGTAQIGQYVNNATVVGTAVDASGNPIDADNNPANGVQLIQPTSTDPSHYYGYNPALAELGDYTWIDLNNNGQQDSGEPALGGVTVHLLDNTGNPVDDPTNPGTPYVTTTDSSGIYDFVDLAPGDYKVKFDVPSAYSLTTPNAGGDDTMDSDADNTAGPTLGETGVYHLNAGDVNTTVDAGFIARASLGDRVWIDSNGNGIQDASETSTPAIIQGMQVQLYDGSNNLIATTFTDDNGNYLFNDLVPGSYHVKFPAPPSGYLWTTQNAGSDTTIDSDVNVTTYTTANTSLNAGQNDPTWDAGLVAVANIGDYVWEDTRASSPATPFNGIQNSGETGVQGVTVRLLNSGGSQATDDNGNLIPDQMTAADGSYHFTNLRPGDYAVQFTLPAGYIFTTQDAGSDDSKDSDASPTTGRTIITTLDPGETDNSWDAGLIKLASLGDKVWLDTQNDGQQNGGDAGVAGATVTLLNANTLNPVTTDALGNAIAPITTTASGLYSFTNLDPRIPYVVEFQRPASYVFSPANQGADATDSDAVPSASLPTGVGRTGTYTLESGENNTTVDAGLVQPAAIGNFVWYDNDNDGLQNGGDPPVAGVTVRLLNNAGTQATDEQGNLIPDQVTDSSGLYHFTNLIPATYSLAFSTLPAGYTFAKNDVGANDTIDSDPNRFTGRTVQTVLSPNEDDTSWDAGLVLAASLGDYVWEDKNADGLQGAPAAEPGVQGITVNLLDGSGNPVDNPNTAAIGDAYTTVTDSSGHYSFVGLPPNQTYQIQFVLPNGSPYIFTKANQGADDTIDSDGLLNGQVNVTSVTTSNITTLIPNQNDDTWDEGVLLPSALGDFVWSDGSNGKAEDGLQTAGEAAISGVTVHLFAADGVTTIDNPNTSGTQPYTVITDANGLYHFTNLYPGTYIIQWDTPSGYKRAVYDADGAAGNTTDSDMQTSGVHSGQSPVITLPYDTPDNSWDAGFVQLAAIGNFVWRDNNGNGIQNAGEPGINGVTVNLYDATNVTSGSQLATTTTANNPVGGAPGWYQFTNLDPDLDYVVEFVLPAPPANTSKFIFSPEDVNTGGGNDTNDSDADTTTGRTATIPLNPGQTDNDRDAGLTPLAQLGNFLWIDTNGNGIQNGGEPGVNNVTVSLYLASDLTTPIASTTTANNPVGGAPGWYQFLNLIPGNYVVKFDLPTGYMFTRQDVNTGGGTDTNDSDVTRLGANAGFTGTYTLNYNSNNQTVDAGILQPASLGDFVWYDANNDGIQQVIPAEAGIQNVNVHLLAADGVTAIDNPNTAAVDTYVVQTDATGHYNFVNLFPGTYTVKFDLPSASYVIAKQNQGSDDTVDSDADRNTDVTGTYTLAAGGSNTTVDAGMLLRGARLGDFVWIDLNNNGQQDGGINEPGLNGVTVTLLNSAGGTDIDPITPGVQTLSMLTQNDPVSGNPGWYQFTGLVPDSYYVQFTLPSGYQFSPEHNIADTTLDSDADTTTGRTPLISVPENGDDETWDAGLVPLAKIGDYVWIDKNNNGIQDSGELPLSGVNVHLYAADGTTAIDNPNIAGFQPYTMMTDGSGFYQFTNLPPDTSYVVGFDPVAHYQRSHADSGSDDGKDSDASLSTGKSPVTPLAPGEYNDTIDAGYVPLATLGDYVWVDSDGDGVQDAAESGMNGITVNLYQAGNLSAPIASTVTANNPVGGAPGYYQFPDLQAGSYVVGVVLPSGDMFTRTDINSASTTPASNDSNDSDVDHLTGFTGTYTLDWGDNNQTVDAGILQPASLGDFIWNDSNGNGVQDSGELGVSGVTVHLLDSAGNPVQNPNSVTPEDYTTTTDGSGAYHFTGLFPDVYEVHFDLPSGYMFTQQDASGGTDLNDSDADRSTGTTITISLSAGQNDTIWDAGILQPAELGDYVWRDSDDDGVQDGSEIGISGITVHLLDSSGNPVDNPNPGFSGAYTATTNSSGAYHFTDLFPGVYEVQFDLPDSTYVFARQNINSASTTPASDDTNDSDADRTTGVTGTYTLAEGDNNPTVDTGMMQLGSLGDFVWRDINNNGVQDSGELGVQGVTVNLLDENGTQIATQQTDVNGNYRFNDLVPGFYSLEFVLPSNQYQFSPQDQGGDDTKDSDADFSTGKTVQTHLLSGVNDLSWDAGIVPLASIGDRVWIDINNDGIQDSGETDYQGATVNLLDKDGSAIATTTTDVNGNYLFDRLSPGQYGIQVVLPAHYQFSPQDQGGDDGKDSDVDFSTGKTITTTLDPDEHDLSWDAGIVPLVNIGNYVWVDMNNDGVQDGSEVGFPGVTVNLLDKNGSVIATQTTDGNGNYQFTDEPPGQYRVEVVPPYNYQFSPQDASGNDQTDSDVDFSTGRTILFTEAPGADDDTRDAGLVPLSSIGDFVWRDNNGDGIQDGGEPGIPGVTVKLYNSHGVYATQQTDSNGNYRFNLLPPGNYFIEVTAPTGYIHSPQDAGGDDTADSDVDTTTGRSALTTLSPGENDMTWDAGLPPLATIGDHVWVDTNANGIQDKNEPGMKSVRVNLLDGLGNLLKTTTTDSQGNYKFENLLPGSYIVQVVLPRGYRFTKLDQGIDDTVDSDVNVSTGRTSATTLDYGEIDLTWDAGIVAVPSPSALGSIGDTVWVDRNHNGIQDAGEPGIPNATVTLTLPGGSTVTTTTDSNGKYLFTGLFPGDYTVTVDLNSLPPGLQQTYDLDGTLDSRTTVTLTNGEIFLDADFGYASPTVVAPTSTPTAGSTATGWQPVPACQRSCVDWTLYHTNQTGDWEIFRLGDPSDRPSISNNLSQGKGADDMSPSRSPNGDWIVFSSNRDGNWELYLASTDGDSTKTRRLTYNTVAIDTDPVWGPNNYVAYESTRDGNWELYLLDMTTGKDTRLTDNPASDLNPYWSTDGTKLIFQSNRSGKWQIYQLDLATGMTTRLSDGTANDVDPVYSNNSNLIAFRSYRDGDHSKSVLYLMNPDGSNLQRISDVNGDATNPSWSTDDGMIAYQSNLDGDLDIYIYQVSTGITRKLTDNNTPDYAPTWLCNSTTVIFTSDVDGNPNIYTADAGPIQSPAIDVKKDATQMTTDPADDIYPENTPDEENASLEGHLPGGATLGEQTDFLKPDASVTKADPSLDSGKAWEPINSCPTVCPAFTLYQSNRTGDEEVFRMNDTGGDDMNLSVGVGATDQGPTRSPDARWVAFTSNRDGNDDLYLVTADGSGLRRLTSDVAADDDPAWSPDSQHIAFESNRSGRWEIYMMDVQTGIVTQITSGASDSRHPDWSSAGATIAFQSNRDGGWQLYDYDLGTGTTRQLTRLPHNATDPVYSHGAGQIAFTVQQNDGRGVLYLVAQDGSNPQPISDPKGNASNPQWYSDDTLIAYQSDLDGDMDVYVYDLKTQTTRKLTNNSIADYAPTWACGKPDVIFTSFADGNDDIFRAGALPITDPSIDVVQQAQQLTDNPATDNYPLGAPNKGDDTDSDGH